MIDEKHVRLELFQGLVENRGSAVFYRQFRLGFNGDFYIMKIIGQVCHRGCMHNSISTLNLFSPEGIADGYADNKTPGSGDAGCVINDIQVSSCCKTGTLQMYSDTWTSRTL